MSPHEYRLSETRRAEPKFRPRIVKFDIDTVSAHSSYPSLPKVDIHYAMREFDGQLVLDSLKNGADGVVIAGTGSGSVVTGAAGTLEAMEEGLIVAVSTRSPNGGEQRSMDWNPLPSSARLRLILLFTCSRHTRACPTLGKDRLPPPHPGAHRPAAHDRFRLWAEQNECSFRGSHSRGDQPDLGVLGRLTRLWYVRSVDAVGQRGR